MRRTQATQRKKNFKEKTKVPFRHKIHRRRNAELRHTGGTKGERWNV